MELRRVAPVVGLVALLVVDGALIAWAVRPLPAEVAETVSTAGSSTSPPSTTASRGAQSSPTSSASPTPSTVAAIPLTRVAAAAGGGTVWVADSGTCQRPGTVYVSSDGGGSWSAQDAPGSVLRVKADSAEAAFVTGGDTACDLQLWSTSDGASTWGDATSADAAWSRAPDDARSVHTPADPDVSPCGADVQVVDLTAADGTTAWVLCDDGKIRLTRDRGAGWSDFTELDGALALALAPDTSAALVVRSTPGCRGVVPTTIRDGTADDGKCVRVKQVPEGEVAAATSGSRWWIVVGDRVFGADKPDGGWTETEASLDS
jgi:photosystem II stability/assembly factor-like uncharacterized protein